MKPDQLTDRFWFKRISTFFFQDKLDEIEKFILLENIRLSEKFLAFFSDLQYKDK